MKSMSQVADQPAAAPAKTARAILRATGVRKEFRMGDSVVHVLRHVDLTVRAGEFIAIEGRSGSGKSTLLHILGGLESVDGGAVEFEGVDYTSRGPTGTSLLLKRLSRWAIVPAIVSILTAIVGWLLAAAVFAFADVPNEDEVAHYVDVAFQWLAWAALGLFCTWLILLAIRAIVHHRREKPLARRRNQDFGFVFQFYHLLPELNVLENTALAPMIGGRRTGFASKGERLQRARELLTQLGMDHRLKHRPAQLSGGERQRVAIARALMNRPKVLFTDEPTGNLDADTGRQIMAVFEQLHRDAGQTIVMVTHDRTIARRADRALVLREGRLEKPEAAKEVIT
jgi:ABC-type lipoprotein export system ATPase subunit